MQSGNKNILLVGGLGCGLLLTWLVIGLIIYFARVQPASPQTPPTVDSASLASSTPAPFPFAGPAESVSPTTFPTLAETLDLMPVSSPVPGFFGDTPPTGKIAFACYIKQIDQICLMNADGTQHAQLTDFPATAFYPSISPDGETIYFSAKGASGFEIYSISVNGGKAMKLTNGIGSLYAPELSPNGEWVIFTKNGDGLWLMHPDGENPHPLTDRDDIDPTWSPDGSMIAFASSRAGARQLFVMNADGTDIRQVTNLDNMGGRSSWSPDGTQLAFYRGPAGDHNIYIINVDGTGLVQLTDGGDNLGPSWSPDGHWIAFTSFRDGNNEIYLIHPDGTGLTRVTNNPISDWQPRWGR
jgi:tol-pal system beta propeller repeat protein TolB